MSDEYLRARTIRNVANPAAPPDSDATCIVHGCVYSKGHREPHVTERAVARETAGKPDSDDLTGWRCGCGAPISKAQAGCARWPDCVKKPDSDAREVWMAKKECPRCHGVGLVTMPSIPIAHVSLPLCLAQRILAALEDAYTRPGACAAVAAELRAVIGK